jgi:hypothetical protein
VYRIPFSVLPESPTYIQRYKHDMWSLHTDYYEQVSKRRYIHSVQNLLFSRLLSKNVKIRINKTIILPVVLYGCKTWSLTLREDYRLRVFENRVLRKIYGPKRDEVIWGWRKLHNGEFHNLYCSSSIITSKMIKPRRMRWARHIALMERRGMHIGFWWESRKERDH